MKMKELLEVIERAMKDGCPRMAYYGEVLRIHMARAHKDLLDEDVQID